MGWGEEWREECLGEWEKLFKIQGVGFMVYDFWTCGQDLIRI